MASPAQLLANQANAQLSTGPRTAEGKARSSRNSFQHGLTLGVLTIPDEEADAFGAFATEMRDELFPGGNLQEEAFQQFLDGAWRLRRIRAMFDELAAGHEADPLVRPECAPKLHALMRHRAAAEMLVYRSLQALREMQTAAFYRALHLTEEEMAVIPPVAQPGQKIMLGRDLLGIEDRNIFYVLHGHKPLTERFRPEVISAVRAEGRSYFD